MTSAISIIQHYNRLNGNELKHETLRAFHAKCQRFLDGDGHGPGTSEVRGIFQRITKVLKAGYTDVFYEIQLSPIDITKLKATPVSKTASSKAAKRKVFTHKSRGTKKPSYKKEQKPSVEKVDQAFLSGIENLQNDSHVNGKSLGELSSAAYQVITDRILSLIEKDGLVWRKPWNTKFQGKQSLAHNYVTKRFYRGTNFYLNYLLSQFSSPYFFTFKQVDQRGGRIKKGEKGFPVVYFKYLYKDTKKNVLVDESVATINGKVKPGYEKFPSLFYYLVWNYDQCEGIKVKKFATVKLTEKEKIESCENIVSNMPKKPVIKNVKGDDAYYAPASDQITMPLMQQFEVDQEYYSVLFHEMIHSTGSEKRLSRDLTGKFGTKSYAFEELIAELGASFLCGESGIFYFTMKNSAAYIKSWKQKLTSEMKADPKYFLKAASMAEKACQFILDTTVQKKAVPSFKEQRKPVKKSVNRVAKKQLAKPEKVVKKPVPKVEKKPIPLPEKKVNKLGFVSADQTPAQASDTFVLPGVMGQLLGTMQRYKLQIAIPGETHSSKTQLAMQIADAFAELGDDVGWIDYEQGGLQSKDTQLNIERNLQPKNRKRLHVTGDLPRTVEAIEAMAEYFRVIVIDSSTKVKDQKSNAWLDDLREKHPEIVWIPLLQLTTNGTARGGSAAEFDAPVVLKTYRPDLTTHEKNYATVYKNRGNKTGTNYLINQKRIATAQDFQPQPA